MLCIYRALTRNFHARGPLNRSIHKAEFLDSWDEVVSYAKRVLARGAVELMRKVASANAYAFELLAFIKMNVLPLPIEGDSIKTKVANAPSYVAN
eukprot:scaffold33378_cov36-Tisochrysis_lutea.AAC.1